MPVVHYNPIWKIMGFLRWKLWLWFGPWSISAHTSMVITVISTQITLLWKHFSTHHTHLGNSPAGVWLSRSSIWQFTTVLGSTIPGELPEDSRRARELALSKSQYVIRGNVLYYAGSDKNLRVIPPKSYSCLRKLMLKHAFGAHLGEIKVHSQLSQHCWWNGMHTDISKWCKACLVCATRCPSQPFQVPLTLIPVAGPFDRIGVDIIQFPQSHDSNRYAVVSVDYLTKWPEVFPTADQSAATVADLLVREVVRRHRVLDEQ